MTVFSGLNSLKIKSFKNAISSFVPPVVTVPLKQERGKELECLVKPGETVEEGQLIATSKADVSSFSSNIYSPIPGKVESIEMTKCPDGTASEAVKIRFGGSFTFLGRQKKELSLATLTAHMLVRAICDAGILNTFQTSAPVLLAADIQKAVDSNATTLVVRLFDDDPSRLTDSLISKLFFDHVIEGARLAAKACAVEKIVYVSDLKSKEDISQRYEKIETSPFKELFVYADKRKYPVGFKFQLYKLILSETKGTAFGSISQNDLYTDSSTMFELYRTVKFGMPVVDRYVHVNGDCLHASGLMRVLIGTKFDFIAEQYGNFLKKPSAVIVNGLLNGFASSTVDVPVTKYCKSINFLTESKTPDQRLAVCIRCGNCRRACPRSLSPDVIYRHITGDLSASKDYIDSASLCDNCGLCSSVCPARLPLGQQITDFIDKK